MLVKTSILYNLRCIKVIIEAQEQENWCAVGGIGGVGEKRKVGESRGWFACEDRMDGCGVDSRPPRQKTV